MSSVAAERRRPGHSNGRALSETIEELDALIGYGFDYGAVVGALGVSHDALLRAAQRAARPDLADFLARGAAAAALRRMVALGVAAGVPPRW